MTDESRHPRARPRDAADAATASNCPRLRSPSSSSWVVCNNPDAGPFHGMHVRSSALWAAALALTLGCDTTSHDKGPFEPLRLGKADGASAVEQTVSEFPLTGRYELGPEAPLRSFTFVVPPDATLLLAESGELTGSVDTVLRLYRDEDGDGAFGESELVQQNDDRDPNDLSSYLDVIDPAPGHYHLVVQSYKPHAQSGGFDLNLDLIVDALPGPACRGKMTAADMADLLEAYPKADFELPPVPDDLGTGLPISAGLGNYQRRIYRRACSSGQGCGAWEEQTRRMYYGSSGRSVVVGDDYVPLGGKLGVWTTTDQTSVTVGLDGFSKYDLGPPPASSPRGYTVWESAKAGISYASRDSPIVWIRKQFAGPLYRNNGFGPSFNGYIAALPWYAHEIDFYSNGKDRSVEMTLGPDCFRAVEGPFDVDESADGTTWTQWVRVYSAEF